MKTVLLTLLTTALLALAGTFVFIHQGWYDTSATKSHTAPVYRLLEVTMQRAVQTRAADVEEPANRFDAPVQRRGAACFRDHCMQCHGGPGVAQHDIGKSLQPLPGPLVDAARRWRAREIYWITRHGIKMSGMPAWELRLNDEELWAVTAFVERMARLSPADFHTVMEDARPLQCPTASMRDAACAGADCAAIAGADRQPLQPRDADLRAHLVLTQYACVACHRIPGVVGPTVDVGPPLEALHRRRLIAGRLPADEAGLTRWIRDPQGVKPGSAMPDMGVTEEHARLMAQYLLRSR